MSKLARYEEAVVVTLMVLVLATVLLVCLTPAGAQAVRPLGMQVGGPREVLADSMAALRVLVTDHAARKPVQGAQVSVWLVKPDGKRPAVLVRGTTDARGRLELSFEVPNVAPGAYEFVIQARHGAQVEETRQAVRVTTRNQVLLTTDKPLYKPSQVVHVRALALRKPALGALGGAPLTFEISDPKGNKVFKHRGKTNDYGVAFCEFQLGDEINLGDYRVVCLLGDERVEKNITVKRYVLPKFKVVVTPDKQYYLPGETARGTVQVDYFFGKPVTGGQVKLTLQTFDVAFKEIAVLTGNTDGRGMWKFEARLPREFVGQPLEQGKAFLQFEAAVTDQAEHTERAVVSSRVAAAPLEIHAVPESGTLVPGVENLVYVLVSRPTGEPVKARVGYEFIQIHGATPNVLSPKELVTDELGIAELRVIPEVAEVVTEAMNARGRRGILSQQQRPLGTEPAFEFGVKLSATAADGTKAQQEAKLPVGGGSADTALLLRTDKVLSRVGDTVLVTAYTGAQRGTIYFDVVKERQTMLTLAADLERGQATVRLPLTPQLGGTVWVSAYRIQPHGEIVRAMRPLYVNPANELKIAVRPDQNVYRPGPDNVARINFAVTDPQGRPVAAALGVNVVDESLFAIQDMQPGLEKVYFYLEKELATPRYEIHGYELPNLITRPVGGEPIPLEQDTLKQQAARVMTATAKAPEPAVFSEDTYAERLVELREKWAAQLRPQAEKIQQAIQKYNERHRKNPLKTSKLLAPVLQAGLLKAQDLVDPWGTPLTVTALEPQEELLWAVVLWSCGPDREKGTEDDLYVLSGMPWQAFATLAEAREMRWGFGGRGGMLKGGIVMARPMAAMVGGPAEMRRDEGASKTAVTDGAAASGRGEQPVRVRQFFPETLLVEPALITDGSGKATLSVPMADSITSWRITALANSLRGALGSTTGNLRCFQDFFIDIDLPVALTQGDRVSVPVAVYNYLPETQKVRLELTKADWFELTGPDQHELTIGPNEVDVRYFTITAKKIGSGKVLVHGYGSKMSDAIERVAEVEPNGKLFELTASGRLSGSKTETLTIPADAIADASNILVKVYPGIFSQAVEGLDSILRMPGGCFEQTSSTTYPNVLVLDYMKTIGRISPEIQMKAEGFINNGYQRLVTFEVPGGGFSWFGDAPANKVLTAFGLMEFHDMARVHEVDPNLISRTQQWLLSQQGDDGAWEADKAYLHQEAWSRIQNSKLPPTAYVAWGLAYSACKEPGVAKAIAYLREHWGETKDPYVLAMVANALVNSDLPSGTLDKSTEAVLERLVGMAQRKDGQMWWETEMTGITHSSGQSSDLEATGMAALALIAAGRNSEATEVLNYLIAQKDPSGTWYSTQATTLALRALMASQKASTTLVNGEVSVLINGQQAAAFGLTPENADVMRQVDGRKFVRAGGNEVTVKFEGKGSTLYQVVGRYYLPWEKLRPAGREELDIKVAYDRTTLHKDDMVTADVTVKNNLPATTSMIIVDLGIPPGFEVQGEDLANLVEKRTLQKYSLTGRQIICYLEKLEPQQTVSFSYRLRAKFPIKAQTPKSRVYEYYNPDRQAEARPVDMTVQ